MTRIDQRPELFSGRTGGGTRKARYPGSLAAAISTQHSIEFGSRRVDEEYRAAVHGFQQAIVQDPPAIFLAWSERARAVSRRFDVPVEPGRDILTTLRLWRPTNDLQFVGRN